jgi:hypothetical protein
MKEDSKFRQHEQHDSAQQQHADHSKATNFGSVEEMLRFDATQNPPPPEVARKLKESIAREARPTSWWQRLMQNLRGR